MNPNATLYQVAPVYVNRIVLATRKLTVLRERGNPIDRRQCGGRVRGDAIHWLWLILFIGLLLRLLHASDLPTVLLFRHGGGGDSGWYLANGAGFFSGKEHGYIRGIAYYISNLPTPPFYIIFAGIFQTFLPKHESVVAIRIVQCLVSVGTAYLAFRIVLTIVADLRAGLMAAALVALHPTFIVESNTIATETFYVFFISAGLWLYIEYVVSRDGIAPPQKLSINLALVLAALAFGMATLTRAVAALFPLGLVGHMLLLNLTGGRLRWFSKSLLLLVVYGALLSTWTIHNLLLWNRFVILSDQLMPAIWRAAVTNDGSPEENDELLLQDARIIIDEDCEIDCKFQHETDAYLKQIQASISQDGVGYVLRRFGELGESIIQPHGTVSFGGTSVREAAANWLRDDQSANGLVQLTRIEGFAIKLVIWILHVFAIVFGLAGIWMTRKSWRHTAPLAGFLAYTTLIHFIVLDAPRYLFPNEIIWIIFASISLSALAARRRRRDTVNPAAS